MTSLRNWQKSKIQQTRINDSLYEHNVLSDKLLSIVLDDKEECKKLCEQVGLLVHTYTEDII